MREYYNFFLSLKKIYCFQIFNQLLDNVKLGYKENTLIIIIILVFFFTQSICISEKHCKKRAFCFVYVLLLFLWAFFLQYNLSSFVLIWSLFDFLRVFSWFWFLCERVSVMWLSGKYIGENSDENENFQRNSDKKKTSRYACKIYSTW